jgi:hypothetical protein
VTVKLLNAHAGNIVMSQRIDQFNESLRLKLANVDSNINALKVRIDGKARNAELDVQNHLDAVDKAIEQGRGKVAAAQAEIKKWAEQQKAVGHEKIAEWKAKRDIGKLKVRADLAESYAAAAIDVAVASVDEAERAALEAWLARADADRAGR